MPQEIDIHFKTDIYLEMNIRFEMDIRFKMDICYETDIHFKMDICFEMDICFKIDIRFEIDIHFETNIHFETFKMYIHLFLTSQIQDPTPIYYEHKFNMFIVILEYNMSVNLLYLLLSYIVLYYNII